jgi:hypothetical protein
LPVQDLIASFLAHFKGVAAFVEATKAAARAQGGVRTLLGRQRPIKGLAATDKRWGCWLCLCVWKGGGVGWGGLVERIRGNRPGLWYLLCCSTPL